MKKFKISLVAIFAVILASVASSFTVPAVKTETTKAWFEWDNIGSKTDQDSYEYMSSEPVCTGDGALCAVYADIDDPEAEILLPDEANLSSLGGSTQSNNFQQVYEGPEGEVILHP